VTQREQASGYDADLLVSNTLLERASDMTTVLVSELDPRGPKAVALAADAGQWLRCRTRDGRKAYGVPASKPGRYYLTTRRSCDCPDFEFGRGRDCKHVLAVELHCQLLAERAA